MAKERMWQKKRKRNIKIGIGVFLLILVSFGLFLFMGDNVQSENTQEKFSAVGEIPFGDFFALANVLNPEGLFFNFVGPTSNQAYLYSKMYDSPYIYKHSAGQNVYMGSRCTEGQLIKFVFCDSATDKSSCKTNMFDNLWQVHSSNNYPIAKDFYIDDMEFYWSYSCYKAYQTYPDIEKNYLYNNQCVGYDVSKGQGTKYDTQKYCLEALEKQKAEELKAQQEAEAKRQEELRIANLKSQCTSQGGSFSTRTEKCTLPPTPPTEPDNTDDTDNTGTPTDDTTSTDDITNDNTNTDTNTGGGGSVVTCKAYESIEDNKCSFSISKVFSSKGFAQYWDEEPLIVVFAGLVLLILVVVFVPKKKKGGKN